MLIGMSHEEKCCALKGRGARYLALVSLLGLVIPFHHAQALVKFDPVKYTVSAVLKDTK